MSQILHILRKDVRQFWKEILVSLALLVLYTLREEKPWLPEGEPSFSIERFISYGLLLTLSWLFLTVRVVQAEPLVGQRQFWITRPVQWPKLLAEKVLFLVLFIYVPLLCSGMYLLHQAGFSVGMNTVTLVKEGVFALWFIVAAVVATVAITRSVVQWMLVVLAISVYLLTMAWVSDQFPSTLAAVAFPEVAHTTVTIIALLAVVLMQYARRWTKASLVVIAISALLIPVIFIATPSRWLNERAYPSLSSGEVSLRAAFDVREKWKKKITEGAERTKEKKKKFYVPIAVSGVPEGSSFLIEGAAIVVRTASGTVWRSDWVGGGVSVYPQSRALWWSFEVDSKIWEALGSTPSTIEVSLAFREFRDEPLGRITLSHEELAIPDLGLCWVPEYGAVMHCRYPVQLTRNIGLQLRSEDMACETKSPEENTTTDAKKTEPLPPGLRAYDWVGENSSGPFAPVGIARFGLNGWEGDTETKTKPQLCSGTPVLLTTRVPLRRGRIAFQADGILLSDYKTPTRISM